MTEPVATDVDTAGDEDAAALVLVVIDCDEGAAVEVVDTELLLAASVDVGLLVSPELQPANPNDAATSTPPTTSRALPVIMILPSVAVVPDRHDTNHTGGQPPGGHPKEAHRSQDQPRNA
jgi:hypothetical protein